MSYDVGDLWTPELTVKNAAGTLTAATVTLAVTDPSGTVTAPTVSTASTGVYTASVPLDSLGQWVARWTVAGTVTGAETQYADVRAGNGGVTLARVKKALGMDPAINTDDDELQDVIDEALSFYESLGFSLGTETIRLDGGRSRLILPLNATRITALTYTDGTTVDVDDLVFDTASGFLTWGYNTAGYFTSGAGNVIVTFAVSVPAHHRREIISDIAGYWSATQRGSGAGGPRLPGEGYGEPYSTPGAPLTSFPRIQALAERIPSIA